MTKVDQFESAFRAAAKPVYEFAKPEIRDVLVVTDFESTEREAVQRFEDGIKQFLSALTDVRWTTVAGDTYPTSTDLLGVAATADLVCTYRHLHSQAWEWPHSLGTHVDVLTQAARCPILVVPHPERDGAMPHAMKNTDVVMAITDHLAGDANLVNWAEAFTNDGGVLHLTHIEDETAFNRYLDTISKIPGIETETASEQIRAQLLKEPADYIESCRAVLAEARSSLDVQGKVAMGHRLSEYKRLIERYKVDLLVMNTKDEDQHAMHGMAYPLAVELRDIPLLML